MILNRFSRVPFILLNLRAPEAAAGGGGDDIVELPKTAPEITGKTPEEKVTSAGGIITDLFGKAVKLFSSLATANASLTTEQAAHTATKGQLTTEQAAHTATKGQLTTEQAAHTATKGQLTASAANVTRLEKLCDLNGIDSKAAVVAEPEEKPVSDKTPKGAWDRYCDLQAKERKGEVELGTAHNYYRENKALLNKHAVATKTR